MCVCIFGCICVHLCVLVFCYSRCTWPKARIRIRWALFGHTVLTVASLSLPLMPLMGCLFIFLIWFVFLLNDQLNSFCICTFKCDACCCCCSLLLLLFFSLFLLLFSAAFQVYCAGPLVPYNMDLLLLAMTIEKNSSGLMRLTTYYFFRIRRHHSSGFFFSSFFFFCCPLFIFISVAVFNEVLITMIWIRHKKKKKKKRLLVWIGKRLCVYMFIFHLK